MTLLRPIMLLPLSLLMLNLASHAQGQQQSRKAIGADPYRIDEMRRYCKELLEDALRDVDPEQVVDQNLKSQNWGKVFLRDFLMSSVAGETRTTRQQLFQREIRRREQRNAQLKACAEMIKWATEFERSLKQEGGMRIEKTADLMPAQNPAEDASKAIALFDRLRIQEEALKELAEASTLHCVLETGHTAKWERPHDLEITEDQFSTSSDPTIFYDIDLKAKKAKMMGNQGSGEIVVLISSSGLSFIERTTQGADFSLHTTTVFATYKEGTRAFPVVHSRHLMLLGTPLPSQYHGTCSVP